MKIIINADDFGKTHSINKAVCYCFEKGYITNTTLMVNMPFTDEAVKLAKEKGFWNKVGIHLNLTEGIPLNKQLQSISLFCDKNGNFKGSYQDSILSRFWFPKAVRNEVKSEIELQMKKFLDYAPEKLHLDSHHHIHTDLSIFRLLKPFLKEYNYLSVRLSKNVNISGSFNTVCLKKLYKKIYNSYLIRNTKYATDLFCDFADFLYIKSDVMNRKKYYDNKTLELMCHPDFVDGKLKNLWTEKGNAEDFDIVLSNLESSILVSYKDL